MQIMGDPGSVERFYFALVAAGVATSLIVGMTLFVVQTALYFRRIKMRENISLIRFLVGWILGLLAYKYIIFPPLLVFAEGYRMSLLIASGVMIVVFTVCYSVVFKNGSQIRCKKCGDIFYA